MNVRAGQPPVRRMRGALQAAASAAALVALTPAAAGATTAAPGSAGAFEVAAVPADPAQCDPGTLDAAQRHRVLEALNTIRRRHGLGEVRWDSGEAGAVMQAALMFAANGALSHRPAAHWACYSALGARGAAISNIHLWRGSPGAAPPSVEQVLASFLHEAHAPQATELGHRRWLLDPFLKRVAFGRVGGWVNGAWQEGFALSVVADGDEGPAVAAADHWAWPQGEPPAWEFHPQAWLSFSAIVDRQQRAANAAVDYRGVRVSVRRADGRALPLGRLAWDHQHFGLPNHLRFQVAGAIEPEVEHLVRVEGVRVAGQPRDFEYRFRLRR